MSDEEDEIPEYSGSVSDEIQNGIEQTIREGLSSKDLSIKMKAVSLAMKIGMVKVADRNIKISESTDMITSIMLMLMIDHGYSLRDLVYKMSLACRTCRRIGDGRRKPKVKN